MRMGNKWLLAALLVAAPAGLLAAPKPKTIRLFNGKSLDGFYTFLRSTGREDPEHVFTIHNKMAHVSGKEYGYFITEKEYENYRLVVEFKWGAKTHPPREGKARDSGVLFHVQGPDKVWPYSIEFQMIEGGTGDIILVDGAALTVNGVSRDRGRFDRYNKGPWQDVVGFRDPKGEVEKPHGQWNRLELLADGDTLKYYVNGKLVNAGTGARRVPPGRGQARGPAPTA